MWNSWSVFEEVCKFRAWWSEKLKFYMQGWCVIDLALTWESFIAYTFALHLLYLYSFLIMFNALKRDL